MNHTLNRMLVIPVMVMLVLLYGFCLTPSLYAQGGDTTTVTTTQSSTVPPVIPVVQEDVIFGALNPTTWDWALRTLSAFFLAAVGAWAIYRVFLYVTEMQNKYYDIANTFAGRGQVARAVIVSATMFAPEAKGEPGALAAPEDVVSPKKLNIKGPNSVTVNLESSDFVASFEQQGAETPGDNTITWQIVPEGAAILSRSQGATVRLTAKQLGAFILLARAEDPTTGAMTEVHFPVAVIAPTQSDIPLPFIGEGWGTIILAILFGTIIALLGLSRVLSTSLVGTLLGALLGYIFSMVGPGLGRGVQRSPNPGAPPPSGGPNPGSGANG